jgi:topoisomerase-4 subunit A
VTDKAGAKLQITYKGAHATRPADEVDVDEFVGVKSHRAKGKRLSTYDVDTLTFIEPEEPELTDEEDTTEEPEPMENVPANEAVEENNADEEVVAPTLDISDMLDDKDVAPLSNGVKIEIERPHNDLDDMINPEQLNLF